MMSRFLAFIAGSLVMVLVSGVFYYQQEKEFTAWMDSPTIDAYLAKVNPPKESGKKNPGDRGQWIYAVEARQQNNVIEYRVKHGAVPAKGHPYWWYWYVNFKKDGFDKMNRKLTSDGFILAYENHYMHSDGEPRYQAVWQKVR